MGSTDLLEALRGYIARQQQEQEEDSMFGAGWCTPAKPGGRPRTLQPCQELVPWAQVEGFLGMLSAALKARGAAQERLLEELNLANRRLEREVEEKQQVARQESAAAEDSSFLASEVQALMREKQALKQEVQRLERDKAFLQEENRLLRRQVEADGGEEGAAALAARVQEELRCEQQRGLVLENEAMQLRARVAALERANQAQHVAMLSCIEESERCRLQHESASAEGLRLARLDLCGSPVAHADWLLHHQHSEATCTDEFDTGSHASCATPSGVEVAGPGELVAAPGCFGADPLPSPSVLLAAKVPAPPRLQLAGQEEERWQQQHQQQQEQQLEGQH